MRQVLLPITLTAAGVLAGPAHAAFISGIDTSTFQGFVNWTSVKNAGVEFAFTKATEGVGFTDNRFVQNMTNAKAANVLIGPYHFARPDSFNTNPLDAANEANWFVDQIEPFYQQGGYLRPVLDVEVLPGVGNTAQEKAFLSEWVRDFADVVQARLGTTPIIYANANYANNYFESDLAQYDLWLARWTYNTSVTPTQSNLGIWDDWDFWQWSDSWSVSGIAGAVDGNVFDGTQAQLESFVLGAGDGTKQFAGSGRAGWDSAGNWLPTGVPGVDDEVFLSPASGASITGPSSNTQIGNLTIGGPAPVTLVLTSGVTLTSDMSLLAAEPGTTAQVNVAGDWVVTDVLTVGSSGPGVLNLDGGSVSATNGLTTGILGTLTGDGTFNANLNHHGTFAPGSSAGLVQVNGDYDQAPEADLIMEIGGTTPGTGHDQVNITGTADLDGTLDLILIGGFTPTAYSDSVTLLTAGSIVGVFDQVLGMQLTGNLAWAVTYDATSVTATAAISGDLNLDGVVDGNDFGVFAANFGQNSDASWAQGDLNGDGIIDGNDFGLFAETFGTGTVLSASDLAAFNAFAATVPEPASLVVLTLGLGWVRRRHGA